MRLSLRYRLLGPLLVLLAGAATEIARYWRVEVEAAMVRERHRLAHELHDGLAQELAFIRSQTLAMARGASPPGVTPLVAEAADRRTHLQGIRRQQPQERRPCAHARHDPFAQLLREGEDDEDEGIEEDDGEGIERVAYDGVLDVDTACGQLLHPVAHVLEERSARRVLRNPSDRIDCQRHSTLQTDRSYTGRPIAT